LHRAQPDLVVRMSSAAPAKRIKTGRTKV